MIHSLENPHPPQPPPLGAWRVIGDLPISLSLPLKRKKLRVPGQNDHRKARPGRFFWETLPESSRVSDGEPG